MSPRVSPAAPPAVGPARAVKAAALPALPGGRFIPPGESFVGQTGVNGDAIRRPATCLHVRGPATGAGYSMSVFRLGADEARRATAAPSREWQAPIGEAVSAR